jgi:DNA-binding MarR family transcriptional regulator
LTLAKSLPQNLLTFELISTYIWIVHHSITSSFVATTCMCLSVRRAARLITKRYDDALRHLGITSGQFSILVAVSAERPLSLGKLADELGMDRTTLTAGMKPLERDGLINGQVDPEDGRARQFRLTAKGRSVLNQAYPIWTKAQSNMKDRVGNADLDRLRQGLRSLA